jgi:hypothetical protein
MFRAKITVALIGFGVIGFFMTACCCPIPLNTDTTKTGTSSTSPKTKGTQTPAAEEAKTVNVNEDIQVGEVRWKVLEISKAESISGDYGQSTAASGVFIVVNLEAELLGKESGTIDSSQFAIIDDKDRVFESSTDGSSALLWANKETLFFKQVNPNVPITGYAVFDVAKDAVGLKLKIKDLRFASDEKGFVNLGI